MSTTAAWKRSRSGPGAGRAGRSRLVTALKVDGHDPHGLKFINVIPCVVSVPAAGIVDRGGPGLADDGFEAALQSGADARVCAEDSGGDRRIREGRELGGSDAILDVRPRVEVLLFETPTLIVPQLPASPPDTG